MTVWWTAIDRDVTTYEQLRQRGVVAQGWPALGDLAPILSLVPTDRARFVHEVAARGDRGYAGQAHWQGDRHPARVPRVMWNLLTLATGDLVVGIEGRMVRGICCVGATVGYTHDPRYEYAHSIGPIEWVDWDESTLGKTPRAPRQSVVGIAHMGESAARQVDAAWRRFTRRGEQPPGVVEVEGEQRVVFVRIGWMDFYGFQNEETGPVGGGSHNRSRVGAEASNFQVVDGVCRGYAQPTFGAGGLNLKRIDTRAGASPSLDGVRVVMVAPHPTQGVLVVVGWYDDATCYRSIDTSHGLSVLFEADAARCTLLPIASRQWKVPRGARAMGRSNVCYLLDERGQAKALVWAKDVLRRIAAYDGANLLAQAGPYQPLPTAEDVVAELETTPGGQGYGLNAAARKAVEDRAVKLAIDHFKAQRWEVQDVGKRRSYDLHCTRGSEELHVEVKGTTTAGASVLLTANEVRHAREFARVALFVVTGIQVHEIPGGAPTATSGSAFVEDPWHLDPLALTPTVYGYMINAPAPGSAQSQASSHGFKRLTPDNWLAVDPVCAAMVGFRDGRMRSPTGEERLSRLLRPALHSLVPVEVQALVEATRGALAYGHFFYPLCTLAMEQLWRIGETAIHLRCASSQPCPPTRVKTFAQQLNWLRGEGVLKHGDFNRWSALRHLRNAASHPRRQAILGGPAEAERTLELLVHDINALFAP